MSHDVRKRYLLTALLGLLGGGVLLWLVLLLLGSDLLGTADGTGGSNVQGAVSFSISGDSTRAISPGVRVPLDLTITNPHGFAISVSRLNVDVGSVSAPNATPSHPCDLADFTVMQTSAHLKFSVKADTTGPLSDFDIARAVWPRVAMLDRPVNQDGCQGASLTLDYTATGTRES